MTPADQRSPSTPAWSHVEEFLRAHDADRIPHPGGTLLEHLTRVAALLAEWGTDSAVQAAGLCHAAYGTDGFDGALLALDERGTLVDVVGERAEALVYLYASCGRTAVYPRLGRDEVPLFHDRFTGRDHTPPEEDLRAFLAITAANELDVFTHNAELADRYGPVLYELLSRNREWLPAAAWQAWHDKCGQSI
ncbi:DUF6817 domain-containing protein [Kitasatospora aureofaciens]|uniref:DUF6817 domain-containing protein n=1 Tax=Kitasatospora aureofaciens TaxID=1894 RepID=UPI001D343265|nr:hypothetical protein [Kitasatospora aureofaciens]HJD82856.1 hypothetical protein [Kitasatospora aureofaciens]